MGRKISTRIRVVNTTASLQRPNPKIERQDLDEADHEAAERGAGDVADAAEDGRGERLEAGLEADVEHRHAEVQALDDARRARERRADEERQGDRAVDVHAHELGRVAVDGGRAHRPARVGSAG